MESGKWKISVLVKEDVCEDRRGTTFKRSAQRAFHLLSAPLEGEVPAEQGKGVKL